MRVFAEHLLLVYKMNSDIENCFAMDCVREDFARLFISMDGKSNESRKSCQNDDEVKKYIECFDQVSAVKKSIDGKDVIQSGDELLRIYLRSRSHKDEICDRKLAYELQRMRSEVKKIFLNGDNVL